MRRTPHFVSGPDAVHLDVVVVRAERARVRLAMGANAPTYCTLPHAQ